jgi:hypothetical protein
MFVGRKKELQLLRSLASRGKSSLTVIHGRRRIGKTSLVEKAFGRCLEMLRPRCKKLPVSDLLSQLFYSAN